MGIYAADIEVWKDVVGFEDRYEVSSFGNIKSKSYLKNSRNANGDFCYWTKPKYMKLSPNADGYLLVDLCKDKTRCTMSVHRLVASTFVENPNYLPIVNHINSNRVDNRAINLEWTTQQGNIQHSYDSGSNSNKGELHPRHVLNENIVREMRILHESGISIIEIANKFGFRKDTTKSAITGKNWSHVI
jgi:hypothetical protein